MPIIVYTANLIIKKKHNYRHSNTAMSHDASDGSNTEEVVIWAIVRLKYIKVV